MHDSQQATTDMQPARCNVIIAEDQDLVRAGLRLSVEAADAGVCVVAETASGLRAIELAATADADVLLLDLRIPDCDGIEVLHELAKRNVPIKVVICSAFSARAIVERAFEAGAAGYVTKDATGSVVARALREVHAGKRFVDPELAPMLFEASQVMLSEREMQVLKLAGEGMQNAPIAFKLDLATETVKTHMSKILVKLDADGRTDAVARAIRLGLIA